MELLDINSFMCTPALCFQFALPVEILYILGSTLSSYMLSIHLKLWKDLF